MMKAILITLLLALVCNAGRHKHQCMHDKITQNFQPQPNEELSDQDRQHRMLQLTQTRPIKIVIDDSNMSGVTPEQRDLIVGKLVPVSTEFLSRRLKVLTRAGPLKVNTGACYQANVPAAHRNVGLDADLIIYVTASNEPNEGFIAWATACVQDSVTLRPIAGQINFNLHYLSFDPLEFEEQIDTTIHEITHILGFSGNLYRHFTKSFESHERRNINDVFSNQAFIRGRQRQVLKTPKILETARKYFNCPTIDGVEIENEGGSGSAGAHWERAILHNEQMTSSSIVDASYSEFTLSILHDSGWYQVDFSKAEPMFYGENAGCDFINVGCSGGNRREWCNGEPSLCSFNYKYKSTCRSETFSDGCKYAMGYGNGNCQVPSYQRGDASGETYGPSSKCVMGTIKDKRFQDGGESPLCYRYTCTADGKIKFLPSGGGELICSRAGELVQASGNYKGSIRCPDPVSFCRDYYPSCPNSCSSKGYCVRGKCECRAGFSGDDCSQGVDVPTPAPTDFCKGVVCPANSSCNQGTCICNRGFEGPQCKPVDPCTLIKCPSNGYCDAGVCKCQTGFQGPNCTPIPTTSCPNNCNNNGECRGTVCVCRAGFSGNDCSISNSNTPVTSQCPSNCNNRGTCYGNVCKCLEGFSGPACEVANNGASGSCPNNCFSASERGWCAKSTMKTNGVVSKIEYTCKCNSGFSGSDCSISSPPAGSLCPVNCGPKGSCDPATRTCKCSAYFSGRACEIEACINWCDGGVCSYSSKRVNGVETSREYFCRCKDGSSGKRFCL